MNILVITFVAIASTLIVWALTYVVGTGLGKLTATIEHKIGERIGYNKAYKLTSRLAIAIPLLILFTCFFYILYLQSNQESQEYQCERCIDNEKTI
jgi:hypothetical protein